MQFNIVKIECSQTAKPPKRAGMFVRLKLLTAKDVSWWQRKMELGISVVRQISSILISFTFLRAAHRIHSQILCLTAWIEVGPEVFLNSKSSIEPEWRWKIPSIMSSHDEDEKYVVENFRLGRNVVSNFHLFETTEQRIACFKGSLPRTEIGFHLKDPSGLVDFFFYEPWLFPVGIENKLVGKELNGFSKYW